MNLLRKIFNLDKLDSLRSDLDSSYESVAILKSEIEELEEYKLKYRIAKMYIDDDEALLELLEAEKSRESEGETALRQLHGIYFGASADQGQYLGLGQSQAAQPGWLGQSQMAQLGLSR